MSAEAKRLTPLSAPSRFSEAEWQVRCDLAACYRLIAHYRMTDHIYTHLSAHHSSFAHFRARARRSGALPDQPLRHDLR